MYFFQASKVSSDVMCIVLRPSGGQSYMTTIQYNKRSASVPTQHFCNISCIVKLQNVLVLCCQSVYCVKIHSIGLA